jgi:hypothetical protein
MRPVPSINSITFSRGETFNYYANFRLLFKLTKNWHHSYKLHLLKTLLGSSQWRKLTAGGEEIYSGNLFRRLLVFFYFTRAKRTFFDLFTRRHYKIKKEE